MRYRFCGDQDVPDWLLGEIPTMAKLSCVRTKLICKQIIQRLLGGDIDFAKVRRLTPKDKGFEESDMNAFLAATNFLIFNAARNNIDPAVFNRELQQLGIPAESADGISRPYRSNQGALCETLTKETLPLPRLEKISWRVDCCVASNYQPTGLQHRRVQLSLSTSHDSRHPPPRRTPEELGVQVKLATKGTGSASNHADNQSKFPSVQTSPDIAQRLERAFRTVDNTGDKQLSSQRERLHSDTINLAMSRETFLKLRQELKSALSTVEHYRGVLNQSETEQTE
eukprot:gb/GECG01011110.1/.p1 GENE.gb/GECG01011110.1/~~gb/GECG01011110.1/.p1  ORF type:complete len:283 (+),score=28.46 gb/GECG01011110.1/:1-849(+)